MKNPQVCRNINQLLLFSFDRSQITGNLKPIIMELVAQNIRGRVRENTSENRNNTIDRKTRKHIRKFRNMNISEITVRLEELRREWDIVRTLEVNASALAVTSLVLGTFVNRKWFLLTATAGVFLLQHGLQGWCPPLPLFRAMNIRTRQEIDEEIYALKVLRGDFNTITPASSEEDIIESFRQ
jgi:hypothetical protein